MMNATLFFAVLPISGSRGGERLPLEPQRGLGRINANRNFLARVFVDELQESVRVTLEYVLYASERHQTAVTRR
jgi:hypothetical protein